MDTSHYDLLTTAGLSRAQRKQPEEHCLVQLRRGIYVPVSSYSSISEPWEVRHLASIHRAFAVRVSCRDDSSLVFTSEIALKLQGAFRDRG